MVRIIISRTKQKKYYFIVESTKEDTLLTSGLYTSKTSCKKGIASLKNTVEGVGRYQWLEDQHSVSFIVKSVNGQRLATSEPFKNLTELTEILSALKAQIRNAVVMDQTIKQKDKNLY
jgi:uncharacterized protein YegP (UPF0339 family)